MTLSQKVALITSSSTGTCVRMAQQFARAGAKVMICGRNAAQGQATVAQIRSDGGSASFILTDIAAIPDVQAAIDETIATYGRLDILFNYVSGLYSLDGELAQISESAWDRMMETALKGTFFCCQYALPFLRQSGNGTVINTIEQPAAPAACRSMASICSSGLAAITQEIAQQYSDRQVSANLVFATPSDRPPPALSGQLLYGPIAPSVNPIDPVEPLAGSPPNRPFVSVDEAVMYLAQCGKNLQGTTLMVNTASADASARGLDD